MEKNNLLAFLFSLMPGAGEMYLGMMKKGTLIMLSFFIIVIIGNFFGLYFLLYLLPVIWCYSFFDTINMQHFNYVHRMDLDDSFYENTVKILHDFTGKDFSKLLGVRHTVLGLFCILAGLYVILNKVTSIFYYVFKMPDWVYGIFNKIPTVIVGIFIIAFGLRLLKTEDSDKKDDDMVEFKKNDEQTK